MEKIVELQQWAEARANGYDFLSELYNTPPTPELVNQMAEDEFAASLQEVFARSSERMRCFLRDFTGTEDSYRALKLEYDALFRVPGGRYTRPYEAVHGGKATQDGKAAGSLVRGPTTTAVQNMYRQAGAAISEEFKELPDFIGLELEFMSFLCTQEAEAWEQGDADAASRYRGWQQKFLSEHLAQWMGSFCQELATRAKSDFYRGLAEMTQGFVERDAEEIERLMSEQAEESVREREVTTNG
jgi:TorA maturation chaperone TorD